MRKAGMAGVVLWMLAAVAGCENKARGGTKTQAAAGGGAKKGTPLATVGDSVITVEDFEEKVNAQGPFARPRFSDVTKRKEFLDGLIRQEVLAQEAIRRGFMDDPEVQDAIKKVLVQKLTRLEYDNQVKAEDIKPADIKAYYDGHPDEFHKPEMARCSAVVVKFGADKAAARKKADGLLKQVNDAAAKKPQPGQFTPDAFGDLAAQVSEDPESKQLRGDLRYLSRKELDEKYGPKVGETCFGMQEVNSTSGVVEGADGWYLLKHTGRRKPIDRTLDQVETQIRNRLFREKRTDAFNAYVDGLRAKTAVKVDEQKLADMKIAGATQNAPPMPGAPPNLAPATGEPMVEGKDPHAH